MQTDRQGRKNELKKAGLFVTVAVTAIFVILYHSFLFGGQMYAFSDVGADTIDQYLPNMIYETELLRSGTLEGYALSHGFGKNICGLLLKYLNPVNLPLLILGSAHLPAALMVSLYLKYALTGLFALLYFSHLLKNVKAAVLCALLWTFTGYSVLWGQHYNFMTMIFHFTVVMYGFQLYLEEDHRWCFAAAAVALMISFSYYFTYISCLFLMLYGVLYLAFKKEKAGIIIKKAVCFVPVVILSFCMAGESILPEISTFFSSFRVGQVTSGYSGDLLYPLSYLFGYIARFFSNDLFGTGDMFYGPINYYEFAILSVSVLSLFSFAFFMLGKSRVRVLFVWICCAAALCCPEFNQLLTFSKVTQRWTYILCLLQVIGIGAALAECARIYQTSKGRRKILCSILITDVLLLVAALVLYRYHRQTGGWILNKSACLKLAVIVLVYHIGAVAALVYRKRAAVILALVVATELVVANYASVNQRNTVTVDQWENAMYHDGTESVVQWIREQDDTLYRINKTYTSVSNCDALMQGYSGMATYDSTNPAALISLADEYGYSGVGNRIRFAGNDPLANTMLGVKYVIAGADEMLDPLFYQKIYSDEYHSVYENMYFLGFGYIYSEELTQQEILTQTPVDTLMTQASGYYPTDIIRGEEQSRAVTMDLLPYLESYENCEITQEMPLTVTGTGYNMMLQFSLPDIPEDHLVAGIRVTMTAQSPSTITAVSTYDTPDGTERRQSVVSYGAGKGTYTLSSVTNPDISQICLYTAWAPQTVVIDSVELLAVPGMNALQSNLQKLRNSGVLSVQKEGNAFVLSLDPSVNCEGMLALPLVYSRCWEAFVDETCTEVYNINSGLVGVRLDSGASQVRIEYRDPSYQVGCVLTVVGLLVYAVMCMIHRRRMLPYKKK